MPPTTKRDDDALVPLGVGAEIVGVSTTTMRSYADAGRLPVYRTPGGQRRFRVGDLRSLTKLEQPTVEDAVDDQPAAATS